MQGTTCRPPLWLQHTMPAVQVVEENKRQMCIYKLAKERHEPWLWWTFAAGYSLRCTMANGKFGDAACAETETRAIGLDTSAVASCMGDSNADAEHDLLQVWHALHPQRCCAASRPTTAWHKQA